MKATFDRRAEQRQFSPGDQVLALLPVVGSPFQARFCGPFTVEKQVSEHDYLISLPKNKTKLCHINLLKPYDVREATTDTGADVSVGNPVCCSGEVGVDVLSSDLI